MLTPASGAAMPPSPFRGELRIWEESPAATASRVRPFVAAVLLFRSGVRASEVVSAIAPLANPDDLRPGEGDDDDTPADLTRLEAAVSVALAEMVAAGVLRVRPDGLHVLGASHAALRWAITVATATDAQLPEHLLADVGGNAPSLLSILSDTIAPARP